MLWRRWLIYWIAPHFSPSLSIHETDVHSWKHVSSGYSVWPSVVSNVDLQWKCKLKLLFRHKFSFWNGSNISSNRSTVRTDQKGILFEEWIQGFAADWRSSKRFEASDEVIKRQYDSSKLWFCHKIKINQNQVINAKNKLLKYNLPSQETISNCREKFYC